MNDNDKLLPTPDELWEISKKYAYNVCSLQNFFEDYEIDIIRNHFCNGYAQAIKEFVNVNYKGLDQTDN